MRKYLLTSIILHAILIGGLMFSSQASSRDNLYPEVYRVNLVGAKATPPPSKPKTAAPQVIEKAPKQVVKREPEPEGLTMQEKTDQRQPKPQPEESNVRQNTQPQEENSDYPEFLDDIDFGSEFGGIQIDGANFQSSYYINLIFSKIRSRWRNPVRSEGILETTVYFNVDRSGRISNADIESPSGVGSFDQSALRAILASDPLPPLPQEFSGDNIGIHLKFEYTP
ncbi:MAG: TonB family protein [candidate division Zixibacteria bacterium]|nr:TonB family protein [candidate division Zixibacteria bacterium]